MSCLALLLPRRASRLWFVIGVLSLSAHQASGASAAPRPATTALPPAVSRPVDFARDVQPIFEANCVSCHGPKKQKGGFRLDLRADAMAGGDNFSPAILPGQSAASPLIHAVAALDEDFVMPEKGDRLTVGQIGILRAWIDQGATWPDDGSVSDKDKVPWSFAPIARPAIPAAPVPAAGFPTPRTPVDRFIFAKLAASGLTPSVETDRRTLLRRLQLILHGLPPSPEEVEAFVRDPDPQAYEKLVDRLLASPRFGERWAQHWLDVVRFAETSGSESNLYRKNAWPYRDYVIRAFNEDKPFDRFIREQIAGDADGVDEATAFLVTGMFVAPATVGREEQAIRQARADRLDETIQSVSASLLGVTMACARCHNHKFDPIPQKDYYALAAVFQGVEYGSRPWRNLPDTAARARRAAVLLGQIETLRAGLRRIVPSWTEEWPSHLQTHFAPVAARAVRVTFPGQAVGMVDEFEIFEAGTGGKNLALAANGATARSSKAKEVPTREIANVIDGRMGRTFAWPAREAGDIAQPAPWFEIELPKDALIDHVAISTDRETIEETDYLIDPQISTGPRKFRVEIRTPAGEWREIANVDLGPGASSGGRAGNPEQRPESPRPTLDPTTERLRQLNSLVRDYAAAVPPPVFAGFFVPPGKTRLLGRGDPMNPREEVVPNALSALRADLKLTSDSRDQERRLAFVHWVIDPQQNPLTPRVLANRLWLHVFGRGIVETPGDFGKAGLPPSHPELLDWLASEFVALGWSAKKTIRLLVTSAVFRQASASHEAAARVDSEARLLWRFPPRRVEAEVLRDATLAVAGTLDPAMGGPGFRIHGDKRRFESWQVVDNAGPATWRRMIYQERMRGIDDGMFTAFDRPECGQVTPKRTVSTTPLQALNLLNGDFILTQAGKLAEQVTREAGPDTGAQVRRAFARAFGRAPQPAELRSAAALVRSDGLAALCRALFNANEFAFID